MISGRATRKQLWSTRNSGKCAEQISHSNRNIQPTAFLSSTPKMVSKFKPFKHLSFNKYDGFYHKNYSSKTDGQKHVVCVNFRLSAQFNRHVTFCQNKILRHVMKYWCPDSNVTVPGTQLPSSVWSQSVRLSLPSFPIKRSFSHRKHGLSIIY